MELQAIYLRLFSVVILFGFIKPDSIKYLKEEDIQPVLKSSASDFTHHEIVVPVILKDGKQLKSTWHKGGHQDSVTVEFTSSDGKFVVDLTRNRELFSKSYLEKSYFDKTKYRVKKPHHKKLSRHCFYHGHIRDIPNSLAALSTCDGVSGYIHDGTEGYHIESATDIDKYSHRLYKDVHSLHKHRPCGAPKDGFSNKLNSTRQIQFAHRVFKRMRRSIREPYDVSSSTRYVEMYVVNDYKTFVDSNSRNLNRQIRQTQNIINIVSRLYRPFNIYIALVGIENWTKENLFLITDDAESTLQNFLHYRESRINAKHPNDNAQLITRTTFSKGVVGKAIKGTICTYQYSGGVNLNLATPGQTAATIAHELGHNFGMDHDNYTTCQCEDDKCIMASTSGGQNTPVHWSSCSMLALQEAFEMGMDYCLRNKPEHLAEGPVCGNGFTEEGEECDCGLPEMCENKCCNATSCTLTPGSTCALGRCCDLNTCKPRPAATMCRAAVSECDLPEFCRGNAPYCPIDVFVQNGVECLSGQSYCYNGECKTHTGQCRLLWGSTGHVSDTRCFKHLNTNGSKHGNCGYNWTTKRYEPCLRDDVMCGLLHCIHKNEKLMFWKDNLAHATPATFLTIGQSTYICRGAMLDVGLDMPDPGMVPDGAKCSDQKICVDHKCTPLSHLNISACHEGCSDRGVCNSKGNCHCDEGFGPPVCDVIGNGGSVDSGPVKIHESKSLLIVMLVFILVVVPLVVGASVLGYYYRHLILAWWHHKFDNNRKHKEQSRPLRPSRPPPKPDHKPDKSNNICPPPPYPASNIVTNNNRQPVNSIVTNNNRHQPVTNIVTNNNRQPATNIVTNNNRVPMAPRPKQAAKTGNSSRQISDPVLMGSTNKESKSHIQLSPVPAHKREPQVPPKPTRPASPPPAYHDVQLPVRQSQDSDKPKGVDIKAKFNQILKMPSFSRSRDDTEMREMKPDVSKPEPVAIKPEPVKKREINRQISNPVLISTTDRRSMHLIKHDKLNAAPLDDADRSQAPPPLPPHVNISRSESENRHRNRPLPPRPLSMPESECGDELQVDPREARKSVGMTTRMPDRPPPPPVNPNLDRTRFNIEAELARIDNIHLDFADESKSSDNDSTSGRSTKPKTTANTKPNPSTNTKPKTSTNTKPKTSTSTNKPKTSTKPTVSKSNSDSVKRPMIPAKTTAAKTRSDSKIAHDRETIEPPMFNPKSRPGVSKTKPGGGGASKTSSTHAPKAQPRADKPSGKPVPRKDSTDSIDEDADSGSASVSGLTKMFEVQKKPLLQEHKSSAGRAKIHGEPKVPMAPPKSKPEARKIRSVNV